MNIFWLFCIFLGLTFSITSEGPDSARYVNTLKQFHEEGVTWSEIINSVYIPGSNFVDVVQPVLTWFISLFSDNPSVLFAGFALIFGFFYSRNLWYLFDRMGGKVSLAILIFILTFALINPIWNINGFRMYAASQVFLFGLLPYLVEDNKRRLWWSAGSILFHFSFILPVAILATYVLFRNRLNIYFIFFIVTSFINTVNLESIRELLDFLPAFLDPRVESYTDLDYAQRMAEASKRVNWYVPIYGEVLTYTTYLFAILIFLKGRNRLDGPLLNLFCFGIWFYAWANLASLVPSGGRFVSIANLIMVFFITLYFKENYNQQVWKVLRVISLPGLILFIIVAIRIGFDYISFATIFGNPIFALFIHDNTPLITYVKEIL